MNLKISENILGDDIGYARLVESVGGDVSIVNAARVSFGKAISLLEEKDERLIRFLLEHNHGTPLEHNSMTFLIKCPIFVARQWHRHRIGVSINEISARYTEVKEEFYIPKQFRKPHPENKQASQNSEFPDADREAAEKIFAETSEAAFRAYHQLLEIGVCREQARTILPLNIYTEFYWTCNLRSLLHFIGLRDHPDAQWEIQQYAKSMLQQAKSQFPATIKIWESRSTEEFENAGKR